MIIFANDNGNVYNNNDLQMKIIFANNYKQQMLN